MDFAKLNDLEEAIQNLSDGLDAVRIMVMGLERSQDAHAGGFYAVWRYLDVAKQEVQKQLAACMETI